MSAPTRALIALFAANLAVVSLLSFGSAWRSRAELLEQRIAATRAEAALFADLLRSASPDAVATDEVGLLASRLGLRVTLIDAEGRVVADSATPPERLTRLDNHLDRPEVQEALRQGTGESWRVSATTGVSYFYRAQRVEGHDRVRFVRLAVPADRLTHSRAFPLWLSGLGALGASVFLTFFAARYARAKARPIERMTDAVERAAGGQFELDLPAEGGPEVARLSAAVRTMQGVLLEKIVEVDAERSVLSSVVSGMKEGLLLVEPDSRIRLANGALRTILGLGFDPVGYRLAEVVRHPTAIARVQAALSDHHEPEASILRLPGSDRSFELRVTPISSRDTPRGVLVLLFDITQLERLERVRREFVANVSHELRTPVTAIKASVETLLDDELNDPTHIQRFLAIISRNTDHMSELIEDLTDLSLIETGAINLQIREVDAAALANKVVERMGPVASERGVTIHVDFPGRLQILADRRRLEQMLTNLVDNALKFNRRGGAVYVRGEEASADYLLSVEDTGEGIPVDSRERIFHRFYQVSGDRSRAVRGTGLGLAIVKHLMRLHGGSVHVESELGQGSTFVLTFPKTAHAEGTATVRTQASHA